MDYPDNGQPPIHAVKPYSLLGTLPSAPFRSVTKKDCHSWHQYSSLFFALGLGGLERWIAYPILLWITGFGGYLMGHSNINDRS